MDVQLYVYDLSQVTSRLSLFISKLISGLGSCKAGLSCPTIWMIIDITESKNA